MLSCIFYTRWQQYMRHCRIAWLLDTRIVSDTFSIGYARYSLTRRFAPCWGPVSPQYAYWIGQAVRIACQTCVHRAHAPNKTSVTISNVRYFMLPYTDSIFLLNLFTFCGNGTQAVSNRIGYQYAYRGKLRIKRRIAVSLYRRIGGSRCSTVHL